MATLVWDLILMEGGGHGEGGPGNSGKLNGSHKRQIFPPAFSGDS